VNNKLTLKDWIYIVRTFVYVMVVVGWVRVSFALAQSKHKMRTIFIVAVVVGTVYHVGVSVMKWYTHI
jgi:hypothetical protein